MESKPVSTKQKESLVIILIDNVPVSISTKNKTKMKNLVHLFLAILYYLTVFSFIIVILSIGYQFLKWIWE